MASLHSRRINRNLLFYGPARYRILDAIGPDIRKFILDTVVAPVDDTTGDMTAFTATVVEEGTGETVHALTDGALVITTAANENDGINLQLKGEAFRLSEGNYVYFGIRLKATEVTQSDLIVGLCITDTDLMGGMTDGIYFEALDGVATLTAVLEKNSTETTSGTLATLANDTYVELEFLFNGTNLDIWVDGVIQTRLALTNLPNDEYLTPSLSFFNGEASVETVTIDWWRVIQVTDN